MCDGPWGRRRGAWPTAAPTAHGRTAERVVRAHNVEAVDMDRKRSNHVREALWASV
jgi:hypothetical protein